MQNQWGLRTVPEPSVNVGRYLSMERTIITLVIVWFGLNALIGALLLTRRSRPGVRDALRWVTGDQVPARPLQLAHALIVAHKHRH
jgi:hypothetical protein